MSNEFMEQLSSLLKKYPENESVKFIVERFTCDNYRGIPTSNHNRQLNFEYVSKLLEKIYEKIGLGFLRIRNSDLSKNPTDVDWPIYAKIVQDMKNDTGKGGDDSIRKQLFVDMSRMEFIERFNKNMFKEEVKNNKYQWNKFKTTYVRIPKWLEPYLTIKPKFTRKNLRKQFIIKLNILTNGILEMIIQLDKKKDTFFDLNEFAFFISGYKSKFGSYKTCDLKKIESLLKSWRSLGSQKQQAIVNFVKNWCDSTKKLTPKNRKRDFSNLFNHAKQLMYIISQTSFYKYLNNEKTKIISTNIKTNSFGGINGKRSLQEKNEYYKWHKIECKGRSPGFNLHHIVPLYTSSDREEYKILDNHKNLLLIDSKSHNIIHSNKKLLIELNRNNDDLELTDLIVANSKIRLIKGSNVIYLSENFDEMKKYNSDLLS